MENQVKAAFPRVDLILGAVAIVYLILFSIMAVSLYNSPTIIAAILTASIAVLAPLIAAVFSYQTDQRARISIAFEIARRWDDAPYLKARDAIRGKNVEALRAFQGDDDLKLALIHFTNLFWEIAVATRTKVADESYLKERFRLTLNTQYPALRDLLFAPPESGALVALDAITWLHERWNVTTPVPGISEIKQHLTDRLSQFEKAAKAVPSCNAGSDTTA